MTYKKEAIGVQLWSVKNDLATDFEGTLQALACKGFSYAEAAGYSPEARTVLGVKPGLLKRRADALGLDLISLHANAASDTIELLLEDGAALRIKYIICSMFPDERRTVDSYKEIAETYNKLGRIAKKAGIQLGYHNHHFEFEAVNGTLPFDTLLSHTDPELVVFELDLGWVVQAGHDPDAFIQRYPGRFPLWHLRDVDAGGQPVNAGDGIVDFPAVFRQKEQAGMLYSIIETPSAAQNGLERVAASYNYFEKKRLCV
ncbi:sugar phosphate isomerase/epimerase family protein [Niabella ginsenosidivorans]|nr:sugar phosphate isomerase/epimerase [Niabella ginsenosidivorans]